MAKLSQLSIFQAYDYYHHAAAKAPLSDSEKRFMQFCMENHVEICDNETPDDDPVIAEATQLYMDIE